jgi:hypothetical protein
MDKIKKLSQAIRLGAKLRPKMQGMLCGENGDGVMASCAIGAAWEAVNVAKNPNFVLEPMATYVAAERMRDEFGLALNVMKDSPLGGFGPVTLGTIIIQLNDSAEWTREQIADWLESEGL